MKKIITFLITFFIGVTVNGQEIYDLSLNQQVGPVLNPAFTGATDFLDVKLGYKKKFSGLKETPQSFYAGAFGTISGKENRSFRLSSSSSSRQNIQKKHGFGGFLLKTTSGPYSHTRGLLSYALHFPMTRSSYFTLGTSTGITNYKFNLNRLDLRDADLYYESLLGQNISNTYLELSLGGLWHAENYHIGYAVLPVAKNAINEQGVFDLSKNPLRHVINVGVSFNLNTDVKLIPGMVAKLSNDGTEIDYSMKVRFFESIWGGVMYRQNQMFSGMLGLYYNNQLNISYAYDYSIKGINNYSNGSHEIVLGLMLFNNNVSLPHFW